MYTKLVNSFRLLEASGRDCSAHGEFKERLKAFGDLKNMQQKYMK